MNIRIRPSNGEADAAAAARIREQVFHLERGIPTPQPNMSEGTLHLLACEGVQERPVAVLSVVPTTDNEELHRTYGLLFSPSAKVARYAHMAVLKPWRSTGIPLMLMAEAYRTFVQPQGFHYTWLLLHARTAANSNISTVFGFDVSQEMYDSDLGLTRVLCRSERSVRAAETMSRVTNHFRSQRFLPFMPGAYPPPYVRTVTSQQGS